MKIAPLAKIAAAKKRLIERPKEMKMTKIDVEALWQTAQTGVLERTIPAFASLILEEAAKACLTKVKRPADYQGRWGGYGPFEDGMTGEECAAAIRALKP